MNTNLILFGVGTLMFVFDMPVLGVVFCAIGLIRWMAGEG